MTTPDCWSHHSQSAFDSQAETQDTQEFWDDIQKTATTIVSDFSNWLVCTFSEPLKEISQEIDAFLFPPPHQNPCFPLQQKNKQREERYGLQKRSEVQSSPEISSFRKIKEFSDPKTFEKGYFASVDQEAGRQISYSAEETRQVLEPQHHIPDIGLDTQCYAYKSHAVLTVHKVQNVNKIIESSITYGDFKLKGPGFHLENIRIPIRKGGNQIITVKLVTYSATSEAQQKSHSVNALIEYRVDIPLSLMKDRVHKNWVVLSAEGEIYRASQLKGIMPEAVYVMQSDERNFRTKEPRINFSLWKCMQGLMDIAIGGDKCKQTQRIYVGYFDDPLDLAVAQLVNQHPSLLHKKIIQKDRRSGQYFIDETLCGLSLEENGNVIVHEGGTRQPLLDYLSESVENLEWETPKPVCAIDLVNPNLLPQLNASTYPWELELERPKAMALGCHRAAIREQIAIDYLKGNGLEAPPPIYAPYIEPVALRPYPDGAEVLMTYAWGPNFSSPHLVPVEKAPDIVDVQQTSGEAEYDYAGRSYYSNSSVFLNRRDSYEELPTTTQFTPTSSAVPWNMVACEPNQRVARTMGDACRESESLVAQDNRVQRRNVRDVQNRMYSLGELSYYDDSTFSFQN